MTGRAKRVIRNPKASQPLASATVSSGYVSALLRFAVARGVPRPTLLQRSGLTLRDLRDRDGRTPLTRCAALMAAATELSGEPGFALQFGAALGMDVSVALLAAGSAATIAEAGAWFNHFGSLVLDTESGSGLLKIERDRQGVWLEFRFGSEREIRPLVEAGFAWCVTQMRALPATAGVLKTVFLRGAAPADTADYARVFAVPVIFGAERDALLLDDGCLSVALPPTHPYVAHLIHERAETLMKDLAASRSVRGRVERHLAKRLAAGPTDMETVARDLRLSRQTLRRRLQLEGCNFEQVLEGLRQRLALSLLDEGKFAVKDIAARLGFSEPAAFSRAFKRWTGMNPSAARRGRGQATSKDLR